MPDTSNAIKFAPVLDPTPEEIERISNAASSVCDGIRQYDQAMGGKTFRELPAAGQPLAPFLTLLLNVDALVIAIEEANKFDAEPSYPPDDFEVCGWPRVEDVRETLYEIWQALEALESVFRPVVPSFISGDGRYTLYRFWNVASARGKKLVGWWYPADEAERLVIHGYGTIEEPRSSLALDAIEDAMKYECTAQRLQELVNSSNYLGTVNPELALRIEARQSANEPPRDLPADYVTEDVELDPDRTWPRCSDWEGVFAGDAEMLEAYDGNELAGTFASLADQLREQTVDTERMLDAELVAAGFEPVGHDKRKRHRLCLAIGFPPDQMTDVERLRDHVAAWTIRQKAASAASRNTDQAGYSDVGSRPAMEADTTEAGKTIPPSAVATQDEVGRPSQADGNRAHRQTKATGGRPRTRQRAVEVILGEHPDALTRDLTQQEWASVQRTYQHSFAGKTFRKGKVTTYPHMDVADMKAALREYKRRNLVDSIR